MQSLSNDNFGLLVAYVIPGFIVVWATSYASPMIAGWLASNPAASPTVSGFLYVTVASVAAGMLVSAVRWLVIDQIHHRTGVPPPAWDFARFSEGTDLFLTVVEHQYRYYQFYSGSMLALMYAYVLRRLCLALPWDRSLAEFMGMLAIGGILFAASRDTLRKYYHRLTQLHDAKVDCTGRDGVIPSPVTSGNLQA